MNRLVALVFTCSSSLAFADKTYDGSGVTAVHDCAKDGPVAVVDGSGNAITFKGRCDKVSVIGSTQQIAVESVTALEIDGSGNTVAVGAVDRIAVTGSSNRVTYHRSLTRPKPRISVDGASNRVTRSK